MKASPAVADVSPVRRLCIALAILVAALAAVGSADAWRTSGRQWQTRTIGYYNLAPEYKWSIPWATYVWNASGANIRFAPVARARAELIIARKHVPPDSSEDGIAFTNTLNGSIVSASIGLRENLDDYEAALVATHELGHVLGLAHEDRGCAVMNSWLFGDHPFKCQAPAAGKWWCQLLTKDDILGAVRIYGGTPKDPVRPNCARHS